jgi:hypothetical protein
VPKSEPGSVSEVPPATPWATIPFTLDAFIASWDDLVAEARGQSRFLGEAMSVARPVEVAPPRVILAVPDGNPMHAEALERQRGALESLLERRVGSRVQLRLAAPAPDAASVRAPERPRRLSDADVRTERLRAMSAKDPALETAAGELDLEVLD